VTPSTIVRNRPRLPFTFAGIVGAILDDPRPKHRATFNKCVALQDDGSACGLPARYVCFEAGEPMSEQTAYPLYWPERRPRTPPHERRTGHFKTSFAKARDNCLFEIRRLGGTQAMISTNVRLKRDGTPEAVAWGARLNGDNGAAVYFNRKGKDLCFACDRWVHVQDNMHAISLTIQALRGIARWGTGDMMEAAFRGYMALPAVGESGASEWHKVLGVAINASTDQARVTQAWEQFQHLNP
jgi:hypothetical protein